MKALSKIILALLFVASTAGAQTVDEVISKHIAAKGGSAKLASLKTIKMTSSMDMMGMKLPIVQHRCGRRKRHRVAEVVTFQGMTQNGSSQMVRSGWICQPFPGKERTRKGQRRNAESSLKRKEISQAPYSTIKKKEIKLSLWAKKIWMVLMCIRSRLPGRRVM
jgi:hypothetical protein